MGQLVAVTGANDFIGSSLTEELGTHGCTVRALMRPSCDRSLLEGVACEQVSIDYHDQQVLRRAFSGARVVFHVAARASDWGRRSVFQQANVEMTRAVAEAAKAAHVSRLVFVSSAVVYGCGSVRNAQECDAVSEFRFDYSRTKREAEDYLLGLNRLEVVIARPGDVIGPRDKVVSAPMLRALRRGFLGYVGAGDTVCCYTYIGNLVTAIRLAAEQGRAGEAYNISDGVLITWRQLFTEMARQLGCRPPWLHVPLPIAYPLGATLEWLHTNLRLKGKPFLTRYRALRASHDCCISIEKAGMELGYQPKLDFEAQIRATVDWFKRHELDT